MEMGSLYFHGTDPASAQTSSSQIPGNHVFNPVQQQQQQHQQQQYPQQLQHPHHQQHQQQQQQQAKMVARKPSQSKGSRGASNGTPPGPHDVQNYTEGGSKRKRASLACNTCRLRKSKCDAGRPKCMVCTNLDFECVYQYTVTPNNAVVGKEYLLGIEARMKCVEQLIGGSLGSIDFTKLLNSLKDQQQQQTPAAGQADVEMGGARATQPQQVMDSPTSSVSSRQVKLLDDTKTSDNPSDAMGSIRFGNEEDMAFFGPSSTISFIDDITSTIGLVANPGALEIRQGDPQRRPGIAFLGHSRAASPLNSYGTSSDASAVNISAIPLEHEVRSLVDQYFQNTNILYPFVHKQTFLTIYYKALKADFDAVRRTWLGLLNIIMAIGATTSIDPHVSPDEKSQNAEVFYQRAFELCFCRGHALRSTCLESVILLTLMSQYLQSTRKPSQCWSVHGLAVRVAMQLGLHSNESQSRFLPIERDLRRRAWYGCVYHDRTLSMTFGRPMSIPQCYVSLQLPVNAEDEEFLKMTIDNPPDPASAPLNSFLIVSMKLSDILATILVQLYGSDQGCGKPKDVYEILSHVPGIERSLHEWRSQLPPSLSIRKAADLPIDGGPATILWRQNLVLTLRYLQTRLIVHRVVVVQLLRSFKNAPLSFNISAQLEDPFVRMSALAGVETCVDTAREIVYIVDHVVGRPEILGAWWYTLFYVFNAALVVSAHVLLLLRDGLPALPDLISASLADIERAECVMEKLAANEKSARSCLLFLNHLRMTLTQLAYPVLSANGSSTALVPLLEGTDYMQALGKLGGEMGQFGMEADFDFLLSNLMATTSS